MSRSRCFLCGRNVGFEAAGLTPGHNAYCHDCKAEAVERLNSKLQAMKKLEAAKPAPPKPSWYEQPV